MGLERADLLSLNRSIGHLRRPFGSSNATLYPMIAREFRKNGWKSTHAFPSLFPNPPMLRRGIHGNAALRLSQRLRVVRD